MAEALTQYKLIILYMLDKVDFPLSNTQISHFILEKEYTNYFTLQQSLHELVSSELVKTEHTHNNTQYWITSAGQETLSYFPDKISDAIKEDIMSYFETNQIELKKEISVLADYYRTTTQEYAAHCQIKNRENPVLELTLLTHTKAEAEAICHNWRQQNEEVYFYLMDLLLH